MRGKTITLWKLLVALIVLGIVLGWLLTGYVTKRPAVDQGNVSATGVSGSREREGRVAGDKVEPVYGGIAFTQILQNAVVRLIPHLPTPGKHDGGLIPDPEAEDAVRRTGTNGLPYLTEMIRDGPDRRAHLAVNAFRLLGATASPAISPLQTIALGTTNGETISQALRALGYIGSNSLPALDRLSTNVNTRLGAVAAVLELGHEGVAVGPIVTKIVEKGDMAAEIAVMGLRNFSATNAFPILTNAFAHPKAPIRKAAVEVSLSFSGDRRSLVPNLTSCLYDPDADVRQAAVDVLRRVAPEMFVTNSLSHAVGKQ